MYLNLTGEADVELCDEGRVVEAVPRRLLPHEGRVRGQQGHARRREQGGLAQCRLRSLGGPTQRKEVHKNVKIEIFGLIQLVLIPRYLETFWFKSFYRHVQGRTDISFKITICDRILGQNVC